LTVPLPFYIDEFLRDLRFNRHLSHHTVLAYENDLGQFQAFLQEQYGLADAASVKGIHIRSWLADLKDKKLQSKSLNRKVSALKSFFHYLLKTEKLAANPARQTLLPRKSKSLPKFLERAQTDKLLESAAFPDSFEGNTQRLILELLYQTGMRRAELVNVREKDLNYSRKELLILGKGNKERIIPLNDYILNDLKEYIALKRKLFENPTEYLLSLKSGKKLYDHYVYRTVKKYLNGITTLDKKSPHLLRHTFATQLLNNGADLMAIKDLLGHSGLAATQIYTHVNIEQLKNVYKKAHPKS
jgi:integrase/recombinase XerC